MTDSTSASPRTGFGHGIHIVTWDHRGHSESEPVERDAATIVNRACDWSDLIDELAPPSRRSLPVTPSAACG